MARWIITNDGKTAWDWDNVYDRRKIDDADKFIEERVRAGDEIGCDGRGMGYGTCGIKKSQKNLFRDLTHSADSVY